MFGLQPLLIMMKNRDLFMYILKMIIVEYHMNSLKELKILYI